MLQAARKRPRTLPWVRDHPKKFSLMLGTKGPSAWSWGKKSNFTFSEQQTWPGFLVVFRAYLFILYSRWKVKSEEKGECASRSRDHESSCGRRSGQWKPETPTHHQNHHGTALIRCRVCGTNFSNADLVEVFLFVKTGAFTLCNRNGVPFQCIPSRTTVAQLSRGGLCSHVRVVVVEHPPPPPSRPATPSGIHPHLTWPLRFSRLFGLAASACGVACVSLRVDVGYPPNSAWQPPGRW